MTALIVTPYIEGSLYDIVFEKKYDLVICADASQNEAICAGVTPDIVIGDFDHGGKPDFENIIQVPCEKDDTDTMLCIKYAISHGAGEITIAGGIGGRLDHTIANIQSLAYAEERGVKAVLTDGKNEAFIIRDSASVLRKEGCYFSLFAYGGRCSGVTVSGTKYTLCDNDLETSFPLGVSNEIIDGSAEVSVRSGKLLAVISAK